MPQERKKQSKRTPARDLRSSEVDDLRSDCLETLNEIATEARWLQQRIEHSPECPSGDEVNGSVKRYRKETKRLINGVRC